MLTRIKNIIFNNMLSMLQLMIFLILAVAFFLLAKWLNPMVESWEIVKRSADNVFNFREFILNLVFRVIPILIPILIATASLLLNRYTSIYLKILFEDKNIRRLIFFSCSFFMFHCLVIFFTPSETWGNSDINLYYIKYYLFFLADSLLSITLLLFSVYTIIEVYLYCQPSKISLSFANKINSVTSQITRLLFRAVSNNSEVNKKTSLLKQYIANFTNLIVLAVKSKDNETIRDSLHRLGHNIWNLMLSELKEVDFKKKKLQIYNEIYCDFKGFGRDIPVSEMKLIISLTDRRVDSLVGETNTAFNTAEDQVTQVYKDIFETAFSSKEFFACDCIITNLHEKASRQRNVANRIVIILADLFDVVLSYKHNGYSQLYCEKIVSTIESIYIDNAFKESPLNDMDAYYTLIKKAIFHKEPSVLKVVLKSLLNLLESQQTSSYIEIKEVIYKNLLYAGMYCLEIKSMKCCATLIRYLVTENFDLKELNCSFAKINYLVTKKTVELENDIFFNLLESFHQNKQDDNIFNITKEKRYLLLKFYIVFYSYFKLQLQISIDRISSEYHDLSVDEQLHGKIPFYNIRTVLLDLESHSKKWNELFIDQCENFFIQTAKELVAESDLEHLKSDIFYNGSTYLKTLKPST